jgi:hypothetical protein
LIIELIDKENVYPSEQTPTPLIKKKSKSKSSNSQNLVKNPKLKRKIQIHEDQVNSNNCKKSKKAKTNSEKLIQPLVTDSNSNNHVSDNDEYVLSIKNRLRSFIKNR